MNFGFTDEQEVLRNEVRKLLDGEASLEDVRRVSEDESGLGHDTALWKRIAELGWTGLVIPEAHGGAGLGWIDLVVVLEETGRSLFPSPLVATTLAADSIARAGSETQQARFLPGTLVMKANSPTVLRLFNGDREVRTFRAREFFRSSAVVRIVYDGRRMEETCISAIKIGPLKGAQIQFVPLRQGEFPFRIKESLDLSLGLFSEPAKPGNIIVR